ncbi:MAG: AraC family transcriptional regulator [Sneathiella sp.]
MTSGDQFQFYNSQYVEGITLLEARMDRFAYPRHAHEEYSFGVTLAGDQAFFSRGAYHVSEPGNVILFNPEDIHDGSAGGEEELHYLMLYLSADILHPHLQSSGWSGGADFRLSDLVSADTGIYEALLSLAGCVRGGVTDGFEQERCLHNLALSLARSEGAELHRISEGRKDSVLNKARDYIQANIRHDISLDDLGQELNMSKFHFLRLFREQTGITPYQYVLSCRVEQARKALHGGETVSDIACDYGFFDLSHFNRRFKAVFGVTPAAYQKSILN